MYVSTSGPGRALAPLDFTACFLAKTSGFEYLVYDGRWTCNNMVFFTIALMNVAVRLRSFPDHCLCNTVIF
jgi:hypothetical protein